MKNIFKITGLALSIMLALPSCDDMLEPTPYGQQTIDATFTDFGGALGAANGLYNPLSAGNLYRGNMSLLNVDYASDDVMGSTRNTTGYNLLDYFELPANNQMSFDLWNQFYRIIYRANVIEDRVPKIVFSAGQANNQTGRSFNDQFVGEAKFMRAFSYFNLVRLFGAVPMHITPITSPSQVNKAQAPVNEVYDQIIKDLTEATALLPTRDGANTAGNEAGRPTTWTARAVLADVYLTLKQYENARRLAQEVITQSDRRLATTYAGAFPAKNGGNENTTESLFEVQFSSDGRTTGTSPIGNSYAYVMGPITDANGGNPSLSQYRPTDNENNDNEAGFTGGLIQEYEVGDVRKEVTFQFALGGPGLQRWLTWKHHSGPTGSVGQTNFQVYRLAEMYLIYAEASNELGVLDATGRDYLNQLRRRAFGLPLSNASVRDIPAGRTQAQYRDIIRSERRKELAMENKRWFDLQRYGFQYANQVLKVNQQRDLFDMNKLLLPIAQNELNNNPLLEQNPGYQGR